MAGDANRRAGSLAALNRWGPVATLCVTIIGGYWLLGSMVLDGIKESVAALRTETGQRIDGREAEDRDIRGVIQSTSDAFRVEMGRLGDRLVESNREVGAQINKMRDDLVTTMKEGDDRLERRFDKLDEKFDILLTKIDYDVIEIPWDQAPVLIGKDGVLFDSDGTHLGTLPAVLRLERQ
jgi:hypothetical protein